MTACEKFEVSFAAFLTTYRSQLLTQDAKEQSQGYKQNVIQKLLEPFRELVPHDQDLIEAVLKCEDEPNSDVVRERACHLFWHRSY